MKRIAMAVLAAGAALASLSAAPAAQAREGCGPGYHRGPYGHCRPNRGEWRRGPVVTERLVIGNFYTGRGYWDGRRYWHNRWRDHDRGHWRYRD